MTDQGLENSSARLLNTGDLQGIVGVSLPDIQSLELPSGDEDIEGEDGVEF